MEIVYFSALVVALTQVFKKSLNISSRYIPLTALVSSGLLVTAFAFVSHVPFNWEMVQNALIAGFMACGLWSATSTTLTS